MSTSTIFIKKPINYRQSLAQLKNKCTEYSPHISLFLWMLSGLYSAAKANFSTSITGLSVSFLTYDLILMFTTSIMLYKGIMWRSIIPILFWIGVNLYSLYYNHYLGLFNTMATLKTVRKVIWIPWVTIIINTISLIIRITLTVRVFQLCVHLWFKKKLDEMKNSYG